MNSQRVFRVSPFLCAAAMLFASAFAFASSPQGTFEKTFQVNGPVDLEVLSRSGDITVRTGPAGSVFIRGKIFVGNRWFMGGRQGDVSAIEQHPPLRQEGNSIHIEYVNEHDISVDYEITVPADSAVRTRSGSGDQIIEGTHGNADLKSGSGDMKLARITGEIRVETGSGNVRAHEVAGSLRGGAGSGDIEVEETGQGDIDLHTGSGNVTVRGSQGALHAEAGSGDITAEGSHNGAWEVRTGSGNVHIHLPSNAAFDANISTSSGTIDMARPVEMVIEGRPQDIQKMMRGKVRGGGPLLSVRTGSGDIHVQ
jgi:hypothetical protein